MLIVDCILKKETELSTTLQFEYSEMYYENSRTEELSRSGATDAIPTAPLRWNQHPVISTVLWILGGEGRKSPGLPPASSIDNFKPGPSGLNDYLNKHFDQVERTRRASNASTDSQPKTSYKVDETMFQGSNRGPTSSSSSGRGAPQPQDSMSSDVSPTEDENESGEEERDERTSQEGTQLLPSITSRQQYYGNSQGTGTPQGNYYPAQKYTTDAHQLHGYPPQYMYPGSSSTAAGDENSNQYNEGGAADATPSPQWGFYVAITPPQQDMHPAMKKDLVTIQQQHSNSAQKPGNGTRK